MDSETEDAKSHLETPSKKVKNKKNKKKSDPGPSQHVTVQTKVQVVPEHPNKTAPIVGYFPSGFDPVKTSVSTGFQVYRNRTMNKRLELVVSPAGSPVEFVGTSYSGEAAAGYRAMYALGVFDKETQTLKVVPIAANKIFRLEPKVKGLGAADKEPANSTIEELTPAEKARQTTAMFGTKRDIEKVKKRMALQQDQEPDSPKNADGKKKDVVNKKALASIDANVFRNIPPYDTTADTPQKAYVLDKIILKGEWDYLDDIYNTLHVGEADFSAYPIFVHNRIQRLRNIQDESEKKQLSCIFSYINHLIKFKDQHSMDASSAKSHKIPSILRHRFSTLFAITESKRLPPEKIDLLNSYVLVLTLFTDDFRTDYTDIAKDLRMIAVSVRQRYEHLGCKIIRHKNMFYATLPVPLKFPTLSSRKRKR
ncbi:hypothetical protein TanjilG_07032 [Lupinus angustifolius]|uniref:DNA-directed RNA polymerase I subunit rpa49 n=1 Tax=Lupinus angustifolius TaxID=3871 RepID=A0A4P1QXQ8_LUPAN|nr:PREDICTED: DNA-directed RNA polymerase I subunit rpa49 [Lupinus angustifolius]OIV97280.1 hypothetical protein TanjilG_07032 [Lupinus angustifolius]